MKKKRKLSNGQDQVGIHPVYLPSGDAYPYAADSTGAGDPRVGQEYAQNKGEAIQRGILDAKRQQDGICSKDPDQLGPTSRSMNRNAVVMEAGSTMGMAIAEELSRLGCRLFLCSGDPSGLQKAFGRIRISCPEGNVYGTTFDNAQKETVERALAMACDELGRIDVLVNNTAPDDVMDADGGWQEAGFLPRYFNCVFPVLPIMARQSSGLILNLLPALPENAATASAIRAFSSQLGGEIDGLGITIAVLHPGDQDMDLGKDLTASVARRAVAAVHKYVRG